ncbi:large ribosomal subunit protein bL19m-like [Clavelina lepadiformis]|uniref:large ribosomal subunit protein bL19m-like n=1 Tax=Clavelina lepadiformis TaxID=159417 RepID=UPI0040422C5B
MNMSLLRVIRRLQSSFVAPQRPTLISTDAEKPNVEGREDANLFSFEYIPPQVQPEWHRNKLKYRLERMDCLRRRQAIDIPEFYPGSILAVTVADNYAPGKSMRFAGRCLYKDGFGLGCKFVLRNVIDNEGVEKMYHLFAPYIQKVELLRLEKWIDTDLRFLRDAADQSICEIDPNMQAESPLPKTEELPVYKGKIRLREIAMWEFLYHKQWPRPYNAYLEEHFIEEELIEREKIHWQTQSHLKYDICKHYDVTKIKAEIMDEMKDNRHRVDVADKKITADA